MIHRQAQNFSDRRQGHRSGNIIKVNHVGRDLLHDAAHRVTAGPLALRISRLCLPV